MGVISFGFAASNLYTVASRSSRPSPVLATQELDSPSWEMDVTQGVWSSAPFTGVSFSWALLIMNAFANTTHVTQSVKAVRYMKMPES